MDLFAQVFGAGEHFAGAPAFTRVTASQVLMCMVMKPVSWISQRGADPQIRAGRPRPAKSKMSTRLEEPLRPVTASQVLMCMVMKPAS